MIEYRDDSTFIVLGQKITLISNECSRGLNTVADMGDFFHYMGNEYPTVSTAIFAWQEVNGRMLTNQEVRQVLIDNKIIQLGEQDASQENYEEITDQDIIEEIVCQENSQESGQKDSQN